MFARVSTYHGDTSQLRDGFEASRDEVAQLEGFSQAFLLVDPDHSRAMTVTLWETREALDASSEAAHRMRSRATEPAQATVDSIDNFEVALSVSAAAGAS